MKTEFTGIYSIEAPCKINLHLRVGPRRPDGFHDIESLFAALGFGDSLVFEIGGPAGTCEFLQEWAAEGESSPPDLPPEKNLVVKALGLFRVKTGFDAGLRIRLVKRIPLGAGLGGGSSDAASTLLALDNLAGTGLPTGELEEMAAALGSDVPFFLKTGTAWVSGRGEKMKAAPFPGNYAVLLVKPPFPSSTPEAFNILDHDREQGNINGDPVRIDDFSPENLELILSGSPENWPFYNDFLTVLPESNVYLEIVEELKKSKAAFAGLSGSGSCCFGIFKTKSEAGEAQKVPKIAKNFTKLTFFLAKKSILW